MYKLPPSVPVPHGSPSLGCSGVNKAKKMPFVVVAQVRDLSGLLISDSLGTEKGTDLCARPCQMAGIALSYIAQKRVTAAPFLVMLTEVRDMH